MEYSLFQFITKSIAVGTEQIRINKEAYSYIIVITALSERVHAVKNENDYEGMVRIYSIFTCDTYRKCMEWMSYECRSV